MMPVKTNSWLNLRVNGGMIDAEETLVGVKIEIREDWNDKYSTCNLTKDEIILLHFFLGKQIERLLMKEID